MTKETAGSMRNINIDRQWQFRHGTTDFMTVARNTPPEKVVDLPHDYMIASEVREDAPAGPAGAYYTEGVASYCKYLEIPKEWENEKIFLHFDGVMMNATVEINGCKCALHHYGYTPFSVDITQYVYFGEKNRVTITVNPSMQPNSRWYSGAGIFRSVELVHTPKVYIKEDGIFLYTERIEYSEDGKPLYAALTGEVDLRNDTPENRIVEVTLSLAPDAGRGGQPQDPVLERTMRVQVNPMSEETARFKMVLDEPRLWSAEEPALYLATACVRTKGIFKTHLVPDTSGEEAPDTVSALFGVRTVTADVRRGLQINGKTVKLKGGCLHHDNGVLGAVSLYDAEYRKLSLLKESGFNAVRTTHNTPSAVFIEAADRLGMYIFDEAFDAWGIAKQPGDYNMFFESDWEKDLTAFMRRDRIHPSVIIWSTGNEIPERGGLNNGFTMAAKLAGKARILDPSRPISNGICSFWSGLDDEMMADSFGRLQSSASSGGIQNADLAGSDESSWERLSEAFTNGLDIVGYNYMENKYPQSHKLYPDRVILGSENYPNEIGIRWPMVESTDYVIGDFTWTAFDYIGEAGIGKAVYVETSDPLLKMGPFGLMSHSSAFPWRLANDADFDINGRLLPQGAYRRVVWGDPVPYIFSYDPDTYGKSEVVSKWGFPAVEAKWYWPGKEGHKAQVAVFSLADEVELIVNGESAGVLKAGEAPVSKMPELPRTFLFDVTYEPGTLTAIARRDGKEISRSRLDTCGEAAELVLVPERHEAPADGHSLVYVRVVLQDEKGMTAAAADTALRAEVSGAAELLGFGSGNPITAENYTKGSFKAYRGEALAVLRAGYEPGEATLTVTAAGLGEQKISIQIG